MNGTEIFVNKIIDQDGKYNYAIANELNEINIGMRQAFPGEYFPTLNYESQITQKCLFSSFWHFIVCVYLNNKLEPTSIKYFDCQNNVDLALDAYNDFIKDSCSINCRNKFMEQFNIVQSKYDEIHGIAQLVQKWKLIL